MENKNYSMTKVTRNTELQELEKIVERLEKANKRRSIITALGLPNTVVTVIEWIQDYFLF